MGYSRGASAIGVAKALGEIGAEGGESEVLEDWTLYSSVASCSAGIELMHTVVILVGNSRSSPSPFTVGHAVMRDAIDLPAVMQALENVGLNALDARSQNRLINIFAKAEASPDGAIRGLSSYHARGFGHQRHPACPRGSWRFDCGGVRDRRGLCVGGRRAPGSRRRRSGRGHCARVRRRCAVQIPRAHVPGQSNCQRSAKSERKNPPLAYFSAWAGMTPVAKATAAAWVRFMQRNLWRAASRCVFTLPKANPKISAISW